MTDGHLPPEPDGRSGSADDKRRVNDEQAPAARISTAPSGPERTTTAKMDVIILRRIRKGLSVYHSRDSRGITFRAAAPVPKILAVEAEE